LYVLCLIYFEKKERLYAHENLAYISSIYKGLGFTEIRYDGGGLFNFNKFQIIDYILDNKFWPYLEEQIYDSGTYNIIRGLRSDGANYFELYNGMYRMAKETQSIYWMSFGNFLTDPTIHLFRVFRGSVTRDFFTTSRRFKDEDYEKGISLCASDEEILDIAKYWHLTLTDNKEEDMYHDFRKIFLEERKEYFKNPNPLGEALISRDSEEVFRILLERGLITEEQYRKRNEKIR